MTKGVEKTTAMRVEISVRVRAICPKCERELEEREDHLTEESLETGNTTQRAYYVTRMKERLQARMNSRGWEADRCGRCRDPQ